jgi:protein-ribulosamine 3-kinase
MKRTISLLLYLDEIDPHREMIINPAVTFREVWKKSFDMDADPQMVLPLGGGSINQVYKVILSDQTLVMKVNRNNKYPGMFLAEAKGLQLLRQPDAPYVPEVIAQSVIGNYQFLLLEYLDKAPRRKDYSERFGCSLAALHRNTHTYFGLDHDNRMGALEQFNHQHTDCVSFFIQQRLMPQVKLALEKKNIESVHAQLFDRLYAKLPQLIPSEPPALIHGDLWAGNVMDGPDGDACLIDPAVAYSHREADIAMTMLFGRLDDEFYTAYHEAFPLSPGWEERVDLWNLYPLLVHVNLFGRSYWTETEQILRRFLV